MIRDELKKIGLTVDVVALESGALFDQFVHAKYEAIYFNADKPTSTPGSNPDFWFSFAARTCGISRKRHRRRRGSGGSTS